MGKSYKKNPIVKDTNKKGKTFQKKQATKKVRGCLKRGEEIPNGNAYKKISESWEIVDFVSRWSKEEAIAYYNSYLNGKISSYYSKQELLEEYPTLEDFLIYWKKTTIRK